MQNSMNGMGGMGGMQVDVPHHHRSHRQSIPIPVPVPVPAPAPDIKVIHISSDSNSKCGHPPCHRHNEQYGGQSNYLLGGMYGAMPVMMTRRRMIDDDAGLN